MNIELSPSAAARLDALLTEFATHSHDTAGLEGLSPLLALAVALNLAYINLPKFRYITAIKKIIKSRLYALDEDDQKSYAKKRWYRQLKALADVVILNGIERASIRPEDRKPLHKWLSLPGFWGFLYNFIFYWRLGRFFSMCFILYAVALLAWGAGFQSGAISNGQMYFRNYIGMHFWLTLFATVWPMFVVVAGEYVSWSSMKFMTYQMNDEADATLANEPKHIEALTQQIRRSEGGGDSPESAPE